MRDEEEFVRCTSGERVSIRSPSGPEPGNGAMNLRIAHYSWSEPFLRCVVRSFRGQVRRELRTKLEQGEEEEPGKKADEWPRLLLLSNTNRNERAKSKEKQVMN